MAMVEYPKQGMKLGLEILFQRKEALLVHLLVVKQPVEIFPANPSRVLSLELEH